MLKVAILGGSGYTGCELLRLLHSHPHVQVTAVTSERLSGTPVSDAFLNLRNTDLKFEPLKLKNLLNKMEGNDKLEALRLARADIRRAGYEHPFFWAPFILVGER